MDIARWLAENHEELVKIVNKYDASEEQKLDTLKDLVRRNYTHLSYEELSIMFEDEKLRLILDRYYLKQLH